MNKRIVDQLKATPIPEEFSREKMWQFYAQGLLAETSFSPASIEAIRRMLESEEIKVLIQANKLTLAMIRPELDQAFPQTESLLGDAELFERIKVDIKSPLQIVFSLSLIFTPEMVAQWYGGGATRQKNLPPMEANRYGLHHETRWDEFVSLMLRGPSTFLLLYSAEGWAVENWREQMGQHWDVVKLREIAPDALRARYAKDVHNTVLHGSDSPESVLNEVLLLSQFLSRLANKTA